MHSIKSKSVTNGDGSVSILPEIPFSEFPSGALSVELDPTDPTKVIYAVLTAQEGADREAGL